MKKENWSIGKPISCVVTDTPDGLPENTGHTHTDYYGGALIAESIWRKKDVALISAAPDMLEALQNLENDDNSIPAHAWKLVKDAIKKATTLCTIFLISAICYAQETTPYVATSMGIGINAQSIANHIEAGVEIDAGKGYLVAAWEYRANWLNVLRDGMGIKVGYRFNTDYEDRTFEKGWALFAGYYKPLAYDKDHSPKPTMGYGIRRNHNGIAFTDFYYTNNKIFTITIGVLFSKHSTKNLIP